MPETCSLICASLGADGGGAVRGHLEVTVDYSGRDSVARVVRVGAAGEYRRDDPPVLVDGGTARVAGPHVHAEAGHDALHRAVVVGVAGADELRRPRAGRLDVERTVFGESDHGDVLAWLGWCKAQRRQAKTVYAQDGYVVLLVEDDDLCGKTPSRTPDFYVRRRLPGDYVGIGDDQVPAGDPARALYAVAAGSARHPQRTRARLLHVGISDDASFGGCHLWFGAPDLGQRLQLGDGLREEPGGHTFVEGLQDPGVLYRRVKLREGGRLE